jgi:hypothetical protein
MLHVPGTNTRCHAEEIQRHLSFRHHDHHIFFFFECCYMHTSPIFVDPQHSVRSRTLGTPFFFTSKFLALKKEERRKHLRYKRCVITQHFQHLVCKYTNSNCTQVCFEMVSSKYFLCAGRFFFRNIYLYSITAAVDNYSRYYIVVQQ